jgi:competence protein ComEA
MPHVRLAPDWGRILLFALPPLLAVAVLVALVAFAPAPVAGTAAPALPGGEAAAPLAAPATPGLLVHVSGAVAHPGLYRMTRGDRIYAAIAAAGGLTANADPDRMPNLAGLLRDGEQVKVPALKGTSGRTAKVLVDLNAATEDQLAAVPGFTPDLAAEAIRYRVNFGGFQRTNELVTAVGMDPAAFAIAKKYVRV